MIDNTKLIILDIDLINQLLLHPDFIQCKPLTRNYHSFKHNHINTKLTLNFRKVISNGVLVGYRQVEIKLSPHYHYNGYKHNGNDFNIYDCIKCIKEILTILNIKSDQYTLIKVCNLEFGLNVIPKTDIKILIDGLLYHKKSSFQVGDFRYYKKTNATNYKEIKAYAKGIQFLDYPYYNINQNTFRFEIRTKQFKNIKKYQIFNVSDLLNPKIYNVLADEVLKEWNYVFLLIPEVDLNDLKPKDRQFIKQCLKVGFWYNLIHEKHRNTFAYNKVRYQNILSDKHNISQEIKTIFSDKIQTLLDCANSTYETRLDTQFTDSYIDVTNKINLENAQNNKCIITGLDISMQRKGSKYLSIIGLRFYEKTDNVIYSDLCNKYLTDDKRNEDLEIQFYYIAHNIRNEKTNPIHNRNNFMKRNYNPNQLRLFA